MEWLQESKNPTVLEMVMAQTTQAAERLIEDDAWVYKIGQETALKVATMSGKPHGRFTLWYPGGTVAMTGEFAFGRRKGEWIYFRPDGTEWKP